MHKDNHGLSWRSIRRELSLDPTVSLEAALRHEAQRLQQAIEEDQVRAAKIANVLKGVGPKDDPPGTCIAPTRIPVSVKEGAPPQTQTKGQPPTARKEQDQSSTEDTLPLYYVEMVLVIMRDGKERSTADVHRELVDRYNYCPRPDYHHRVYKYLRRLLMTGRVKSAGKGRWVRV